MKKIIFKLLFIISAILVFNSTFLIRNCQSQWVWQNLKPQSNQIKDFCLFNESTLIAFGYPNTIIKTTNGGGSWINMSNYSFHEYDYKYSYFINENTGWIQADEGYPYNKTLKTTDGGKNWTLNYRDFAIHLLKFLNDNTGYSFGPGIVIKTTNGGMNWSNTNFPGNNIQWTGLDFIDINTGWAAGYITSPYPSENFIMKTTNGGLNWIDYDPGFDSQGIRDIKFVNAQTGWFCGEIGYVKKTTNGGVNWFIQSLNQNVLTRKLFFHDAQTGWILPGYQDTVIFRTTNGGINWIQTYIPIQGSQGGLKFFNQNTGYIFGGVDSRQIIKSTNGGQNWFFLSSGIFKNISSVYFADANYGWAVGGGDNYLRTTNGGNNWFLADIPGIYFLNDVYFKDQQTGWLLTSSKILKTTNSGTNWNILYDTAAPWSNIAYSFSFKNENEIFVPRGYCILKSTNGGANWFRQYINNGSFSIGTIKFFSESNGWLISNFNGSKLFKTTDGGQSWIENLYSEIKINNIYFLNSNTGWLTASKDLIYTLKNLVYKTTNGGLNWVSYLHTDTIPASFDKIFFENENTGISIGWNYLHKTTNGGINWSSYCMLYETFSSMFFLNSNTGWVCGSYGTILKTTTGSSVWVNNISTHTIKDYMLMQNYPNPFNPSTTIRYNLPRAGVVRLAVYDVMGREVEMLVNERQAAGSYEATFDGSRFASGVYFCSLKSGNFSETIKLLLIK
jgi:photosystem II stability/assembly factor-like uncharacterized protein